jgi:hypothetical protein
MISKLFTSFWKKVPENDVEVKTDVKTEVESIADISEDQRLIDEIHNEFDTAPQRILEQALEIINKESNVKVELQSKIEDKALRLKTLGFEKNALVHNLTHTQREIAKTNVVIDMNVEMAHRVKYYTSTYPFLKFLPESELDRICDKYGLVYAPVKHYKMPVPEKNLLEIENAQPLKSDDEQKNLVTYQFVNKWEAKRSDFNKLVTLFGGDTFNEEELKKIHLEHFGRIEKYRLSDTFWYYGFLAGKGKISDPAINEAFIADAIETTYDRTGLFIAAPKEHFDLSGLTFDKNKGFYEAKVRVIKDPIVFRYVKGGIQVLSKWGLEAEDPALQIEILN